MLYSPNIKHYLIASGTNKIRLVLKENEISGNLFPPERGRMYRHLKDKIVHFKYNEKTSKNDIAIVRVVLPFAFEIETIKTSPHFETDWEIPEVGDICSIAGWGQILPKTIEEHFLRDEYLATELRNSELLQVADVKIWNLHNCTVSHYVESLPPELQRFFDDEDIVNERNICAGSPYKDICEVCVILNFLEPN